VRLAEQWSEVLAELPQGWGGAPLTLTVDDRAAADRAATILGPAAPGRRDSTFRIDVVREAQPVGTSAALFHRVLLRLDEEGIGGRLTLAAPVEAEDGSAAPLPASFAGQWVGLLQSLPPDWSHLRGRVEVDSTDYVDRGALLMAPMNPSLRGGPTTFWFRAARTVGYGVAPGMARRCFERLDREGITGRVSILQVVSDARPVATQGPVWRQGGSV
jgi:hypothetical protein